MTRKAGKVKNIKIHFKNRKVADTTECFPAKRESCGYVVFIWEKHYPGHQDLACQQARSRYTGNFLSHMNAV